MITYKGIGLWNYMNKLSSNIQNTYFYLGILDREDYFSSLIPAIIGDTIIYAVQVCKYAVTKKMVLAISLNQLN